MGSGDTTEGKKCCTSCCFWSILSNFRNLWVDDGTEGNDLGIAYGTAEGHRDDSGYDDPMAYEIYYSIAVSDKITVTPAYFNIEKDGADDVSGALVKTTFRFWKPL